MKRRGTKQQIDPEAAALDALMADPSNFSDDEHGILTEGWSVGPTKKDRVGLSPEELVEQRARLLLDGEDNGVTTEGWNIGSESDLAPDRQPPVLIEGTGEETYTPIPPPGSGDRYAKLNETFNPPPKKAPPVASEPYTGKVGRFATYFNETPDPKAVVARAKKTLPGASRDLSPSPERPQFAAVPDDKPKPGIVQSAIAGMAQGAAPTEDKDLAAARERADFNTLATDLRQAGSTIGRAGMAKVDPKVFDRERAAGTLPLDRLGEDRANAAKAKAGARADEDRLIALEEKLRAQGRQAEADKLRAQRDGWQQKFDERKQTETERHNRALEALQRSRGENHAGPGRATAKEQERTDQFATLRTELDRMTSLAHNPNGTVKDDVPGAGVWDASSAKETIGKLVPGAGPAPEDDLMDQSIRNVVSLVTLMRSGKAATDAERRFLMKSYGMERDSILGGRQEKFVTGLQKLREDIEALGSGGTPRHNPGAWATVGIRPQSMAGQPPGGQPQQGRRIRDPNTGRTGTLRPGAPLPAGMEYLE